MGNKNSGPRTTYTQEVADEICDRIAKGEPLKQICRDDHMPDERTVRRWYVDDIGGFAPLYARARDLLLEHWADEIVNISDTTALGVETTTKGDGDVETREGRSAHTGKPCAKHFRALPRKSSLDGRPRPNGCYTTTA